MKDLFSTGAEQYAQFRPRYPEELFEFLESILTEKNIVWDCATGNGQVAASLSGFMQQVEATDISRQQLQNAIKKPNIRYSVQPAENTDFPKDFFDLVTVAQAVHWFNMDRFFSEVKRVLKPSGVLAVIGYSLFRSNAGTDKIIDHFYQKIIGSYWDEERRYLEERYQTIPFPFKEIPAPELIINEEWSFERLTGYLRTWSAVKHYKEKNGKDPVSLIESILFEEFGERGVVEFPLLLRLGKKEA
ncbi:Ubiquinone/menaquinone biosynthesis C-methylase UbiE [Salinimicrobium catena]|uniref:Ubiquinone/menaquinone biosynthesis C-methylase UbiE n=1 Tax=Salinimicrobium catena TaxID=390640 RepID=A0A1H5M1G6_9FLAO|nr:class I SAM-dependent methyltransferase [Salinimicrobium catena]SDL16602.1 Ubiquinone/menaquinone biosynthesis C-methylase UbiE [Salinimicrobium catena]SEE82451.1 Ubiquinone/menaquinone biosynthesis C-methylase UbiE [Salinimicrobium catena]